MARISKTPASGVELLRNGILCFNSVLFCGGQSLAGTVADRFDFTRGGAGDVILNTPGVYGMRFGINNVTRWQIDIAANFRPFDDGNRDIGGTGTRVRNVIGSLEIGIHSGVAFLCSLAADHILIAGVAGDPGAPADQWFWYDTTNERWRARVNAITDTIAPDIYGELYHDGGPCPTPVPIVIAAFDPCEVNFTVVNNLTVGSSNRMTPVAGGTITNNHPGGDNTFEVEAHVCLSIDNNNVDVFIAVFKNNVRQPNLVCCRNMAANDIGALSVSGYVDLELNDFIDLRVTHNSVGPGTISIQYFNLKCVRIN